MVKLTAILNWNGFHNIPKKYINRRMFKGVVYENNHYITPPVVYNYTKDWIYDENAPWTTAAESENDPSMPQNKIRKQIFVPPLKDWFFYRGDKVEILTGKDAGKQGIVNAIIKQRNWVFVEGLNCKLVGFNMGRSVSDISFQQKESPLIANKDVKLVDPYDYKPCDVVYRFTDEGEKVRVSKRTGRTIPISSYAEETCDYTTKSNYKPGPKDTNPEDLEKITFQAKYKTFEQDLMDEYGIKKENKERGTTFIY